MKARARETVNDGRKTVRCQFSVFSFQLHVATTQVTKEGIEKLKTEN